MHDDHQQAVAALPEKRTPSDALGLRVRDRGNLCHRQLRRLLYRLTGLREMLNASDERQPAVVESPVEHRSMHQTVGAVLDLLVQCGDDPAAITIRLNHERGALLANQRDVFRLIDINLEGAAVVPFNVPLLNRGTKQR